VNIAGNRDGRRRTIKSSFSTLCSLFRPHFVVGIAVASSATFSCYGEVRAGYTHYFTWMKKPSAAQLNACVKDMARIIDAAQGQLAGPEGDGKPLIESSNIQFNGRGTDAHEPFVFPGRAGFNFCKTDGKPYDAAVTACLLVARDHFLPDELKIESDGQWEDGDWNEGAKLYQQVLGRAAANPINRSDEPPAGPGIDFPERLEEWGPVSLLVVAGIGLGIVWLLVRPHWSFIIFVERGRIDRVRGDAPRPFLLEVDDICRQFEIPRATIREMQALRANLLLFSRGIPSECRQRIRSSWRANL
jgi:hypothetical protein